MPKWSVGSETGGSLQLVFTDERDMIEFIETVIKPNAALLGLEVEVRKVGRRDQTQKTLFPVVRI